MSRGQWHGLSLSDMVLSEVVHASKSECMEISKMISFLSLRPYQGTQEARVFSLEIYGLSTIQKSPDPRMEPGSPALQAVSLLSESPGKPYSIV